MAPDLALHRAAQQRLDAADHTWGTNLPYVERALRLAVAVDELPAST
jgi:hypothetical protein